MSGQVNHFLSNFVKSRPASPTPLAQATANGRKAERYDVLEYLAALASVTKVEELWEAFDFIKRGHHVRETGTGSL